MFLENLGSYTFPSEIFIPHTSNDPDLSVRLFLIRQISEINERVIDNLNNNVYTSVGLTAEQIDGGAFNHTEPLIMARQKNFDLEFRNAGKTFIYGTVLKDLKVGNYFYKVEVRKADVWDTVAGKKIRVVGDLVEERFGTFKFEYSPMDRVLCVGKDVDGNNTYRSIADMILTNYKASITGSVDFGTGCKDYFQPTPNLDEGTQITITAVELEGSQEGLGIQRSFNVAVLKNGKKGILIKRLPFGRYNLQIKGINTINEFTHKNDL